MSSSRNHLQRRFDSHAGTTSDSLTDDDDEPYQEGSSESAEQYSDDYETEGDVGPDDSASVSPHRSYGGPQAPRAASRYHQLPHRPAPNPYPYRPGSVPNQPESVDPSEEYPPYGALRGGPGYSHVPAHAPAHRGHPGHQAFYNGGRGHAQGGFQQSHVGGGFLPNSPFAPPNQHTMVPYGYGGPHNPFSPMSTGSGQGYFAEPRNSQYDMMQYQHSQPPAFYNHHQHQHQHQHQHPPGAYQMPPHMAQYLYSQGAPPPPPTEAPGPSKTPAPAAPPSPPKPDPETVKLQQQLELFKAEKARQEEADRRKELEEKIRKDAEEAIARRMEDMRKAQDDARKEIERAKAEAEKAAREAIEAERKAEEQRQKLQQEALARAEREAREKMERELKAEAERKAAEAKAKAEAEAAAELKLKLAIQAVEDQRIAAEKKAKEEAEARAKYEAEMKEKAEREARDKIAAEKKAAEEAAAAKAKYEAEMKEKAEREARDKIAAEKKAAEDAAAAKAKYEAEMKEKAEREARDKIEAEKKAAADAAEKAAKYEADMKEKAEKEARDKLEKEAKDAADAAAAAEKAKKEAEDLKKKATEDAQAKFEADAKKVKDKAPIKFKDAVGRKFSFPFHICATWGGMEELIKQAFLHVDVIGPHVQEGHYDLIGPNGEIILPQVWEKVVEPDWTIEMRMWPMDKPPQQPPMFMRPQRPGAGHPHHVRPVPGVPPAGRPIPGGIPVPGGGPFPPGWTGAPRDPRIPVPPPMGGQHPRPIGHMAPEIINVGPKPKDSKKSKGGQGSMLSWMAGKPPKKR
ncbi:kinetoplast-associated protein kap [Colletotrichum plurivorum]|uniref:Kinetoplast-associated protein kap n=1 Tax=Colletotrichum plurivorum TaxID=2175906 RepID=A0A8H6KAE1_9PEZI|nr:kinetoplast-associated protein kap [Colletotrichum plurivorum]